MDWQVEKVYVAPSCSVPGLYIYLSRVNRLMDWVSVSPLQPTVINLPGCSRISSLLKRH